MLVPGDIISIKLGDIVPIDNRLLEGDPLNIDQVLGKPLFFTYFFDNKYWNVCYDFIWFLG